MKLLTLLLLLFALQLDAQIMSTLRGKISTEKGIPLDGAHILVLAPEFSAVSDKNGNFEIADLPSQPIHIHISYVGYQCIDQTLEICNDTIIMFTLKETPTMLRNVVITDNTIERRKREQSTSIEYINQDFLLQNIQSSLMKSLEKVSGVSSIEIGQGFSKPVIRGLSFNRVAVIENGIKQQGQQWGADHGLEIDQFSITSVEIVKGPSSLLYGSDAIGGVILLEQPRLSVHDGIDAGIILLGKSVNNHIGSSINVGYQRRGKFIKARYTSQYYGDYNIPADTFTYLGYKLPLYNRKLKNTAGKEENLTLSAGWVKNRLINHIIFSMVSSKMGFFSGAHGIPSIFKLADDGNARNIGLPFQKVKHTKIINNLKLRKGSTRILSLNAGYQLNHRQEYSTPHSHGYQPISTSNLELDFKLQTITLNVDQQINTSENNLINFGLNSEIQNNTISGYSFLLPQFNQVASGVYIYDKYKLNKKLIINGGIRLDYGFITIKSYVDPYIDSYITDTLLAAKYKVRSTSLQQSHTDYTYAAGLVYTISKKTDLKVNLGKSFRMPTANELSSNGVHHGTFRHEMGDSNLNSEISYQFDAALSYTHKKSWVTLGWFSNYFPNFIFLNPSGEFSYLPDAGQIYKYVQSKAFRSGGEMQIKTEIYADFDLNIAAEYVYAINLNNRYPIPFTPPLNILTEINYHFKDTRYFESSLFAASWQMAAAQKRVARNESATSGYSIFGLAFSTQIKLKPSVIKLNIRADNILNSKYFNHLSFYRTLDLPEAGRNLQISISIPLLKPIN